MASYYSYLETKIYSRANWDVVLKNIFCELPSFRCKRVYVDIRKKGQIEAAFVWQREEKKYK